ncbi:hypothetical protein Ancab_022864, partial [Ancistrocladus abbreviatus]
ILISTHCVETISKSLFVSMDNDLFLIRVNEEPLRNGNICFTLDKVILGSNPPAKGGINPSLLLLVGVQTPLFASHRKTATSLIPGKSLGPLPAVKEQGLITWGIAIYNTSLHPMKSL